MKANIIITQEKKEITYPILARATNSHEIVMFLSEKKGFSLGGDSRRSLGDGFETEWAAVTDAGIWEILPAGTTVTFTQE